MSYKRFIFILFFLTGFIIKAQDPQLIAIDKSIGLPSNSVYHIYQDTKGFMWFTTDKGLVKYDGYEFKLYTNKYQSSKSGTNIKEDKFGRIWYQNFDGYLFYVNNDSLHSLENLEPGGYFNYGIVNNSLFVVQKKGVDVYNLKTLKPVKHFNLNATNFSHSNSTNESFYITSDSITVYRINQHLELSKINFNFYNNSTASSNIFNINHSCILYSRNNPPDRNFIYKLTNNRFEPYFKIEAEFVQNTSYADSSYWFCTPKGVYRYSNTGDVLNNGLPYFKNYNISYVLKDRENNYWISTINSGVLFVKNLHNTSIPTNAIPLKALIKNNKLIYGNSSGELIEYDFTNHKTNSIYKSNNNSVVSFCYYDSINRNIVASNNFVEIISTDGKLKFFSGAVKDIDLIDSNYYAMAVSGCCMLYQISNKKINDNWSSFYNNSKPDKNGISRFVEGCRSKSVKYISEYKTIYYATSYGLQMVTPAGIKELKYNNQSVFCSKLCRYKSKLYGLTNNNELILIDKNTITYTNILFQEPYEQINYIEIINDVLFIASNDNLYRIDLNNSKLIPQLIQKINYEINDIKIIDNSLTLLTKAGLLIQPLKELQNSDSKPLFVLNSISINNQKTTKTVFNYFENNITLNYSILSFKTDNYYPLLYKINNSEWQLTNSKSRSLNLAALEPGRYSIEFKFINDTHSLKTIRFNITKPFWQMWWFIILMISVSLGIIVLIAKWRINELNLKNKLLTEKIENEQKYYKSTLKAIKAQMNPHFFYNALNTIQSFIFSDDKRNAITYLAKFSKLTRLILEMSERDANSITEEIAALQLYLDIEKVRFDNDFNYEIITPDNLNTNETFIPPMLIQPYVENAIKHGLLHKKGTKHLSVEFQKNENTITVTIDDNGIGRKLSTELNEKKLSKHQSFSTAANKQRLDILNKETEHNGVLFIDKTNDAGESTGTTVILTIPLFHRH